MPTTFGVDDRRLKVGVAIATLVVVGFGALTGAARSLPEVGLVVLLLGLVVLLPWLLLLVLSTAGRSVGADIRDGTVAPGDVVELVPVLLVTGGLVFSLFESPVRGDIAYLFPPLSGLAVATGVVGTPLVVLTRAVAVRLTGDAEREQTDDDA